MGDPTQRENSGKPVLVASEETLAQDSPIRENILKWSNVEKGLLVLGRKDYVGFVSQQPDFEETVASVLQKEASRDRSYLAGGPDIAGKMQDMTQDEKVRTYIQDRRAMVETTSKFFGQYENEVPFLDYCQRYAEQKEALNQSTNAYGDLLEECATSLLSNNVSALPFSFSGNGEQSEYGLILEGYKQESYEPNKFFSRLSGQPVSSEFNKASWGAAENVRSMVFIHESGHLRDPKLFKERDLSHKAQLMSGDEVAQEYEENQAEVYADSYLYKQAGPAMGLEEQMDAFYAARSMGVLDIYVEQGGVTPYDRYFAKISHAAGHATSINIDEESGGQLTQAFNEEAISEAAIHVNSLAFLMTGNVLKEEFMQDQNGPSQLNVFRHRYRSLLDDGKLSRMPETFEDEPLIEMMIGEDMAGRHEEYHYAGIKAVLDKGYLPQGSAEERMASQYVKAFELLSPEQAGSEAVQSFLKETEDLPQAPEAFRAYLKKIDMAALHGETPVEEMILNKADETMSPEKPSAGLGGFGS